MPIQNATSPGKVELDSRSLRQSTLNQRRHSARLSSNRSGHDDSSSHSASSTDIIDYDECDEYPGSISDGMTGWTIDGTETVESPVCYQTCPSITCSADQRIPLLTDP